MPRQCGSCTACCTTLVIEALDKPAFQRCPNDCSGCAGTGGGCAVYDDRPQACRNFRCLWLDGHLADDQRPDQLGVMFTTTHHDQAGTIPMLVEVEPGASDRPDIREAIQGMCENNWVLVLTEAGGKLHHPRQKRVPLPQLRQAA